MKTNQNDNIAITNLTQWLHATYTAKEIIKIKNLIEKGDDWTGRFYRMGEADSRNFYWKFRDEIFARLKLNFISYEEREKHLHAVMTILFKEAS